MVGAKRSAEWWRAFGAALVSEPEPGPDQWVWRVVSAAFSVGAGVGLVLCAVIVLVGVEWAPIGEATRATGLRALFEDGTPLGAARPARWVTVARTGSYIVGALGVVTIVCGMLGCMAAQHSHESAARASAQGSETDK